MLQVRLLLLVGENGINSGTAAAGMSGHSPSSGSSLRQFWSEVGEAIRTNIGFMDIRLSRDNAVMELQWKFLNPRGDDLLK